jgi:hypothetical protein
LADGAGDRAYGWGRYDTALGNITGNPTAKIAPMIKRLRLYDRYLTAAEVVGNWHAGPEAHAPSP